MGYAIVSYYFICFLLSIIFVIAAFFQLPSRISQLFQLLTISNFIMCLGYTLCTAAPTPESAWCGIPVLYTGGSFIGLCYLAMCYAIVNRQMKTWAVCSFVAGNLFFSIATFFDYAHHILYKDPDFIRIGVANVKTLDMAWLYYVYIFWNLMYVIIVSNVVYKAYKRTSKDLNFRQKGLRSLINAGVLASIPFVITVFVPMLVDLTPLGISIGGLYLLISIKVHKLYEVTEDLGHTMLDSMNDIVVAYDPNGNFQYTNGFTVECLPELKNFPYNVSLKGISDNVERLMTLKNEDIYELNGHEYKCRVIEIKHHSTTTGYVRWLHDETIDREHIRVVTALKDEAERANNAKSTFLAHITHEIRTPINAVIGMDELIIRETKESFTHNYAQQSMRAGKTLLALVNDILDSSKIEAGKMEIVPGEYNPYQMLDDIMIMTKFRADEKGLYLSSRIDNTIPETLYGDETRVKQIITNIVTNAVKYTERGSVVVEVSSEPAAGGQINLIARVRDTGIGIKKEDLPKLYGSFERIENETTHKSEGTGLGMSITTKLLDLMGGHMDVESEYGKGSLFTVTIPQKAVVKEAVPTKPSDNAPAVKDGPLIAPDARILIVDDTPTNTFLAKALLKNTQIKVDTASSGRECLELAKNNHYDIIFIDYRMPEMDGIETVAALKKDHICGSTPLVMMTAESEDDAREFFLGHGLNDYISKPLDPKAYEAMIRRLLKK